MIDNRTNKTESVRIKYASTVLNHPDKSRDTGCVQRGPNGSRATDIFFFDSLGKLTVPFSYFPIFCESDKPI